MWTKNVTCHSSIQQMLPTIKLSPITAALLTSSKGKQDGDEQDTGHSYDAYRRINFNESRLLHLPTHRKTVKSLTWNVGDGVVISVNLWYLIKWFYFCSLFLAKKLPPLPPLPRAIWDTVSHATVLCKIPEWNITHNL